MADWREETHGTPEDERREFEMLAGLMMEAQLKSRKAAKAKTVDRAFHARSIAAFEGATFSFDEHLPEDLQVGFARAGGELPGPRPLLQRRLDSAARHEEGLSRARGPHPRLRRGAARPPRHQLPGLPRPRCTPVRRFRPCARRRLALEAGRSGEPDGPVRAVGDDPDAPERPPRAGGLAQPRARILLEPRRDDVGRKRRPLHLPPGRRRAPSRAAPGPGPPSSRPSSSTGCATATSGSTS